jgi:glycosyltransferase involved in cell wall biosynthesis
MLYRFLRLGTIVLAKVLILFVIIRKLAAMKHLTIGFDAKRAMLNLTGIGNYSRLVLDVLSSRYPDNRYLLFSPRMADNDRLAPLLLRQGVSVHCPDTLMGRLSTHLWRSRGLTAQLKRSDIDLYHGLSNELPSGIERSGIPSVVTIHDLIFRRVPQSYHHADRLICDWKFSRAAKAATRIVAISKRTAADIVELYGVDPAKIDVVYQGCHPMFYQPVSDTAIADVRKRYALPDSYIVAVGTVEMRKNQLLAVRALAQLPRSLHLVIVGRRSGYAPELDRAIAAAGVGERVHFCTNVAFADLPAVYAGAVVASYTSRYEGFGIPVIEAIAAGVPVVAATGSCLEEAGGPGALYVDPDDPGAYAQAAMSIIDDDTLRQQMVAEGRSHIKAFNADTFADALVASYCRALGRDS